MVHVTRAHSNKLKTHRVLAEKKREQSMEEVPGLKAMVGWTVLVRLLTSKRHKLQLLLLLLLLLLLWCW